MSALIRTDRQVAAQPDILLMADSWLSMKIEERRAVIKELGLRTIWAERPVDLPTFVSHEFYLGHPPLSEIQLKGVEAVTEIFTPDGDLKKKQYVEAVILFGKGAGKDTMAKIVMARLAYLFGCLADPLGYFGMPSSDHIDLLNVAVSGDQASHVFFIPLKRMLRSSEWFTERLTFQARMNSIHFPPRIPAAKNEFEEDMRELYAINGYSGNSETESQEGLNLFCAVLDEIDAFHSRAEAGNKMVRRGMATAESLYDMAVTSVASRFPGIGKVMLLSWPRYAGSFIIRHYEMGLRDPSVYAVKAATWEANPTKTRAMFDDEYRRNPELAEARYNCNPAKSDAPFFSNKAPVLNAFHAIQIPGEQYEKITPLAPTNPGGNAAVVLGAGDEASAVLEITSRLKPVPGAEYYWHIDLAAGVRDRAAACLGHHGGWMKSVTNTWMPRVSLDCLVWFESVEGHEIELSDVRRLVLAIARSGFFTKQVTLDRWQSMDTIQQLRRYDHFGKPTDLESVQIIADAFSIDSNPEAYNTLKDLIYGGRLDAWYEPMLVDELLRLQKVKEKIDHLAEFRKDLGDSCLVGSTRIPLLDGTCPTIEELVGRGDVWLYSCRSDSTFAPGLARARLTKEVTELTDVVLDSGAVIRCTPDHRFMLRDGSYKVASDLMPNADRLMPINRSIAFDGHEKLTNGVGMPIMTHNMVDRSLHGSAVGLDIHVHHDDDNKLNNTPDNLVRMTRAEHTRLHSMQKHASDPAYTAKVLAALKLGYASANARQSQKDAIRKWHATRTPEQWRQVAESRADFRHDITLEKIVSVLQESGTLMTANEMARRLGCGRNTVRRVVKDNGMDWEATLKKYGGNNHTVRYVIPVHLSESVPVYDLEVETWHNFAVSAGVFVHNCAGVVYQVVKNASAPPTEGIGTVDMDAEGWGSGHRNRFGGGQRRERRLHQRKM